jgi:Leucine-rich repeat (LRR) protein
VLPSMGILPEVICSMTCLTALTMQVQTVPVYISTLCALHKLDLSGSKITALPDTLRHLVELEELVMNWCKSLTALPTVVCKMHSLRVLSIRSTMLQELPEEIGGLVKLCDLDLDQSLLLQSLPPSCSRMVCLQRLRLAGCQSLLACPEVVGQLLGLTHLDMNGNVFTELPESLGNLSRLRVLFLQYSHRLASLPLSMSRLSRLRVLDTTDCNKLTAAHAQQAVVA